MRRVIAVIALALALASCGSPGPSGGTFVAALPSAGTTSSSPGASAVPVDRSPTTRPTPAGPATTPFDGVWATKPLTRKDLAATLARRGVSDAQLDEWFPDSQKIDARIFEIEIGDGQWLGFETDDGVGFPVGAGDLTLVDADTVVSKDKILGCSVTYDLSRAGDTLAVRVADDACPDPTDLPIREVIYESSAFRLVQAADWTPSSSSSSPSASPSSPTSSAEASTSSTRQTLRPKGTVKGAPLGYVEYLPPGYGKKPSPLILFLHGSGESGDGSKVALEGLASAGIPSIIEFDHWPDSRPFVVLAPQHDAQPPSFCMTADEIDAFLRFAMKHYDIDPSRVYVTGLSCGAIGLWNYLAAHRDELVAAVVPIAGNGVGAVQLAGCDLARLPIWAFHGALDDAVPVFGDVYPLTTLQACTDPSPSDARLTVYPLESHDAWTITYGGQAGYDIYDWMLGHHK